MDKIETYRAVGTCCKQIMFSVNEQNELTSCIFIHGCSGNQQAVSRLAIGKPIDEIITKLKGIPCKGTTSCPDQLAKALIAYKEKQAEQKQ
ncbi:MAG: TIGR03905 family TSCPD domain-containing protein [Clostridia bacterium]|nr:TIGR03905 family TSCPD domain-containing protein [Clostridia bacterium]